MYMPPEPMPKPSSFPGHVILLVLRVLDPARSTAMRSRSGSARSPAMCCAWRKARSIPRCRRCSGRAGCGPSGGCPTPIAGFARTVSRAAGRTQLEAERAGYDHVNRAIQAVLKLHKEPTDDGTAATHLVPVEPPPSGAGDGRGDGLPSRVDGAGAAATSFGDDLRLREDAREMWGWTWLDRLHQDLPTAPACSAMRPASPSPPCWFWRSASAFRSPPFVSCLPTCKEARCPTPIRSCT